MAEIEYQGVKVGGSKLLLVIPLLSMIGGGAWAGFELYNEFRILKATVMELYARNSDILQYLPYP